jgi:hypothetical protein
LLAPRDFAGPFGAALRGGTVPAGSRAVTPAEAERRFAVYRNNVAVSLKSALAARYPVIRRLVGEAYFDALAAVFLRDDRPQSPVLHEWGGGFAAFLRDFPPLKDWPYMADVARIEWARGLAFHAADAAPADPALLATADPATLRLSLHPSVQLLRLRHPGVTIWAAHQPGGDPGVMARLPRDPETALILRDRGFEVPVRALPPGDAALVGALARSHPLLAAAAEAQAAEPGHEPLPLLLSLMQAGALCAAPSSPEPRR